MADRAAVRTGIKGMDITANTVFFLLIEDYDIHAVTSPGKGDIVVLVEPVPQEVKMFNDLGHRVIVVTGWAIPGDHRLLTAAGATEIIVAKLGSFAKAIGDLAAAIRKL